MIVSALKGKKRKKEKKQSGGPDLNRRINALQALPLTAWVPPHQVVVLLYDAFLHCRLRWKGVARPTTPRQARSFRAPQCGRKRCAALRHWGRAYLPPAKQEMKVRLGKVRARSFRQQFKCFAGVPLPIAIFCAKLEGMGKGECQEASRGAVDAAGTAIYRAAPQGMTACECCFHCR